MEQDRAEYRNGIIDICIVLIDNLNKKIEEKEEERERYKELSKATKKRIESMDEYIYALFDQKLVIQSYLKAGYDEQHKIENGISSFGKSFSQIIKEFSVKAEKRIRERK